jgi:hypothetical protein
MVKIILFLTGLVSFSTHAQIYYVGQGGYLKLAQAGAKENSVYPSGLSYGGGIGFRKNYFEFESLIFKASGEGALIHDGIKNKFQHEQTSLLLGLNFYLNKHLYARFGYSIKNSHCKTF